MLDQYIRARRALNVTFAFVYFCAFASLYSQYPGLYGRDGVLPAAVYRDRSQTTTLLQYHTKIGLDFDSTADLIMISGMGLSVLGIAGYGCLPLFGALWALYFSLFQVGQTFLSFQWDILLLESGALVTLFAPFTPWSRTPPSAVGVNALRLLLFKLMFMSGVVKLQSQGPTWFGLTALHYHYATQCIPTPLAWYAHQLPGIVHKYSVAATLWLEIPGTFLIIAPTRALRLVGAASQILLQLLIILTGNYNFFNLMTIALCMVLIDDTIWSRITKFGRTSHVAYGDGLISMIPDRLRPLAENGSRLVTLCGLVACVLSWMVMFESGVGDIQLIITLPQLQSFVDRSLNYVAVYAAACVVFSSFVHLHRTLHVRSIASLPREVIITTAYYALLASSLVTFSSISRQMHVPALASRIHRATQPYHLTNSYGLFRRMTGVGHSDDPDHQVVARPEVVLEGSTDMKVWKEIEFYYKPGDVKYRLPVVAPHQPRLDWQMWFAALGTFYHNSWLLHAVYKLLQGSQPVIGLLDVERYPFHDNPPKYIRASLYHYDFTSWDRRHSGVWTRQHIKEYMPILTVDNRDLVNFVEKNGWANIPGPNQQVKRSALYRALRSLRDLPVISAGTALVILSMIRRFWRHYQWQPDTGGDKVKVD